MPTNERAPERERSGAAERAPQHGERRPDEAVRTQGQGHDAYGCVDWFDYCPLPRTDPPVRRRS
jgi:hypothetical protein